MLKFSLSEYQQFQTQIAIYKAVENMIMYANLGEKDKISIRCQKHGNEIKILIEYHGKPLNPVFSPLKQDNGINNVSHDLEGGRNVLTLIKRVECFKPIF